MSSPTRPIRITPAARPSAASAQESSTHHATHAVGSPPRLTSGVISTALHGLVLLALLTPHRAPTTAPYRLPGTSHGVRLLTYFAAGSPAQATTALPSQAVATPRPPVRHTAMPRPAPPPPPTETASSDTGTGSASQSGLGEGNINIALLRHFPRPAPDLSALPQGTGGDVILNAVIDEHGVISDLQLLHGLGPSIDNEVMAVVRQWTYAPATRNGTPVPSEQELHFHYQRS